MLALCTLFVGLGFWQLDRAGQKHAVQAAYDARLSDARVQIEPRLQAADDLRFYRVIVEGTYEPRYQVLIDNRIHNGRVGYHVITPLRIRGSDVRVLVNRGWVPLGQSRELLPQAPAPDGLQKVTGVATVPRDKVFTLGRPEPLGATWTPLWQHMDMKRYAEAVRFALQPVVVLLDPDSAAGGFERQWLRLDAGIAVHQGYAFQWFMLAVALLVIYAVIGVRAARARGRGPGSAGGDARGR
jgi:surfeit locus 1 family protein